jgi:hypothetical protein
VAWAVAVTLLAGACGSGETPRREVATATPTVRVSPSATPTTVVGSEPEPTPTVELIREWVAVFRVADARDLQKETDELLRLVPHNIAIAPIGCWVGVPEKLGNPEGDSVYVAAVVAESREELQRVVEKVGREPILVGEFPAMCVD